MTAFELASSKPRRLIRQYDLGLFQNASRYDRPLPFPSGEGLDFPAFQIQDAQFFQNFIYFVRFTPRFLDNSN